MDEGMGREDKERARLTLSQSIDKTQEQSSSERIVSSVAGTASLIDAGCELQSEMRRNAAAACSSSEANRSRR